MAFTAVESASDAIDLTRWFLRNRSWGSLGILAVLSLFLGPAGLSAPPGPVDLNREFSAEFDGEIPDFDAALEAMGLEVVVAGVAVVVLGWLLYTFIGAFVEFAFVASIATNSVTVLAPARTHTSRAFALFLFRAVVWVPAVALVGWAVLAAVDLLAAPGWIGWLILGATVIGFASYVVNRLTTDLVVPIMYHENRGLLSAWRRLLGVTQPAWRSLGGYLMVRIVLEVALAIAMAIALGLALLGVGIIVGIPLGVVAILTLGWLGVVVLIAVLIPLVIAVVAAVLMPLHVYLRTYTLLVLGDFSPALDLVSRRRARVRRESGP